MSFTVSLGVLQNNSKRICSEEDHNLNDGFFGKLEMKFSHIA